MFENDIVKQINLSVFEALKNAQELSYCKIHNGYFPRGENLISPDQFPMIVCEYGATTELTIPRTGVFSYNYIQPIAIFTLADNANFSDLVFNVSGKNKNKGIGDIVYDVKKVLWKYHEGNFGIEQIVEWNMLTLHVPNLLNVQRLLSSLFVRGVQIDLSFKIFEKK